VLYHFCDDRRGYVVTVKALIRDKIKPQIQSLAPVIPGAEWIEREVHDLYGIDFINHPNLRRLILSDDWPEGVYPLRKDNKNEEVSL
jgi:Ni,Fe-hydrogenase III component G